MPLASFSRYASVRTDTSAIVAAICVGGSIKTSALSCRSYDLASLAHLSAVSRSNCGSSHHAIPERKFSMSSALGGAPDLPLWWDMFQRMYIRARKLLVCLAVVALAMANSVAARHALAAVPHHAAAASADDHAHAGHDHGHDAAAGHSTDDGAAPSGALADQNCCAAWCSGVALIFSAYNLDREFLKEHYSPGLAHSLRPSAPNTLDRPPR
ncbi:MAG: hypothetical protein HXY30_12755 [Pseudorhodoplanes sp.]|nr:hypothetical protein [Pseudorhodoplanes sp.]